MLQLNYYAIMKHLSNLETFKSLVNRPDIVADAADDFTSYWRPDDPVGAEHERISHLYQFAYNRFIEENGHNIGGALSILKTNEQLLILDIWIKRDIYYSHDDIEVTKLLEILWPKYGNLSPKSAPHTWPHNEFFGQSTPLKTN